MCIAIQIFHFQNIYNWIGRYCQLPIASYQLDSGHYIEYRSFNFAQDWTTVKYADVCTRPPQAEDLRYVADLDERGKPKPLYPVIK